MRTRLAVAVTLLAVGVGCGPAVERCGDEICTAEQRCTPEKKCVIDTKPVVTLEAPMEMALVTVDTVEVRGNATDDEKPPLVEVSVNQATWVATKLDADGGFVVQLPIPKIDGSSVQIIARAKDGKKQEARAMRTLRVDNTPPTCIIDKPLDGTVTNGTGPVDLLMHASDGSGDVMNAKFSTDGAQTFSPLNGTSGMFVGSWVLPSENGGAHQLVFRVEDQYGHVCEATSNFFVDNVKPTVAFTMPAPSALLGQPFFAAGGKFTGTASDGARLLKSVTMDFADLGGPRPATMTGNTWSVSVTVPAGDDFKTHVATVVATDLGDNTATATLSVTVDVKPPGLTITSPLPNAKLNLTSFPAGTNNAPLSWNLTDGDPQLNLVLVTMDGGTLTPPVVPTSATDNPKTYSPLLRANDRAGNTTTASVTFSVDRVLPTVTGFTPANNTRMYSGIATADFSEPMTFGVGLALNPNVVGNWTTPQHFEVGGLAKDTVYSVITGMTVTDLHGNQVVPVSYRFHTETVVPAAGGLLATGYDEVYDATADVEGTLNVLAFLKVNGQIDWIQFDSKTGVGFVIDSFSSGLISNLVAARSVQADLSSRRLAGLWFNQGTNNVVYNVNGGALTTLAGAQAFIPMPAFAAEGAGLGEYGIIQGGLYKRTGRADLSIGLPDVDHVSISDTRWEMVRHVAGGTQSASYGCTTSCAATPVKTLGGGAVGTPNSAISKVCSIHGYLDNATEMTTIFRYQPGCGGGTNPCAPDIIESDNFDQVVADPAVDGTFYGYSTVSAGQYQIKKRVLAANNCSGGITNVGAPVFLGTVKGRPRLVVIRGVVGLIYADTQNLLKFVTP